MNTEIKQPLTPSQKRLITIKKNAEMKAERKKAYALVGSIGGRATAKKGKAYMATIGKKGAAARWATK